jgi:N-carbamoylputrescine amidase
MRKRLSAAQGGSSGTIPAIIRATRIILPAFLSLAGNSMVAALDQTTVTLALVQLQASPKPPENLERTVASIRRAAAQGAQIICLQELFASRYFCQSEDTAHFHLAEPIPGPTTTAMGRLAAELQVVLIVPLFEQRTQGLYHNSAVVFDADGALLGTYRKMHIPDDPGYYEKFYFTPGDLGYQTYRTRYATIGTPSAGISGFLRRHASRRCRGRRSLLPQRHWLARWRATRGGYAQHEAWEMVPQPCQWRLRGQ